MKRIIRASKQIALDALFAWLTYNAIFNEAQWSWNLVRFWLWFSVIISALCNYPEVKADLIKNGRSTPAWYSIGYDFALAALLAAYGHFFFAVLALLMSLLQTAAFTPAKEKTA